MAFGADALNIIDVPTARQIAEQLTTPGSHIQMDAEAWRLLQRGAPVVATVVEQAGGYVVDADSGATGGGAHHNNGTRRVLAWF